MTNQYVANIVEAFVKNWICRFRILLKINGDLDRNIESVQDICNILELKKTRILYRQSDRMLDR